LGRLFGHGGWWEEDHLKGLWGREVDLRSLRQRCGVSLSFSQEDQAVEIVGEDFFGQFPAHGVESAPTELPKAIAVL